MKKQKFWICLIGGLALLFLAIIALPFISNSRRPQKLSFKIQKVYVKTAKVEDTFNISAMTSDFVVAEGPCGGNDCNGGILSQQPPETVKDTIPNLKGYDGESTAIIWLYQIKPVEITRRNDLWGDDTVTINGKLTNEHKIYFAIVPKKIVEPHIQWVYVETE